MTRLQRIRIGTLTESGLRTGEIRFLTREEVLVLKGSSKSRRPPKAVDKGRPLA